MQVVISGFERDLPVLRQNDEFIKALKPSTLEIDSSLKFSKVNKDDMFTILAKCIGFIYQDEDTIYVKKIKPVYLAEKNNRLFFLSSKKKTGIMPDKKNIDKFTGFHWGNNPDGVYSFEYVAPTNNYILKGVARGIFYETCEADNTIKGDDGPTIYVHAFDKRYPVLIKSKGKYHLLGGDYTIENKGIVH